MEIEYGSEVIDRSGKALGTVDYVIRNTWTGEISKFIVRREKPNKDLSISPQDIQEVTESNIKLSVSSDELSQSD